MNDLVSIIMPAHNSNKTIIASIESVINQTYSNWELLIINDSSSDDTFEIVTHYAKSDERIKILNTDKSLGKPFYPRNLGIGNAKGRYIAFLDSDDIWLPTKLEHQIPLFEQEDVAIVFSYYQKFSEEQDIQKKKRIIKSPDIVNFKTALYGNPIGNLTGVYDIGKVFCEDIGQEDYYLWLTILRQGYIAKNTNSLEAAYRISKTSFSYNKVNAAVRTWEIYRKIFGYNLLKILFCYTIYAIKGMVKYIK